MNQKYPVFIGLMKDSHGKWFLADFYRPQPSCKGYVFTPVCLSTVGSASVHAGLPHPPPGADPPGSRPPWEQPPKEQAATVVDGMHPTGMHSC